MLLDDVAVALLPSLPDWIAPTHPYSVVLIRNFKQTPPSFTAFLQMCMQNSAGIVDFPPIHACMLQVSQIHNSPTPTHHRVKMDSPTNPQYPTQEKIRNPGSCWNAHRASRVVRACHAARTTMLMPS